MKYLELMREKEILEGEHIEAVNKILDRLKVRLQIVFDDVLEEIDRVCFDGVSIVIYFNDSYKNYIIYTFDGTDSLTFGKYKELNFKVLLEMKRIVLEEVGEYKV